MSDEKIFLSSIPNCTYSPSIDKIAPALVRALPKMQAAAKDAKNPHLNSRYADLLSVMEVAKGPLAESNIAILQPPATTGGRGVTVATVLLHESGQWIASQISINAVDEKAQSVGSAITYARRYGVSGLLGIVADEDDDGNAASGVGDKSRAKREPAWKQTQAPPAASAPKTQSTMPPPEERPWDTFKTMLACFAELKELVGDVEYYRVLKEFGGVTHSNEFRDGEKAFACYAAIKAVHEKIKGESANS